MNALTVVEILILLGGSLMAGFVIQKWLAGFRPELDGLAERVSEWIKKAVVLGGMPAILLLTFWVFQPQFYLITLPFLGLLSLVVGGLLALVWAKIAGFDRDRKGSFFVCGMFTNLALFGGLVCFLFYGEVGYALSAIYKIFEPFAVYGFGYPFSRLLGEGTGRSPREMLLTVIRDPFVISPNMGILAGFLINFSSVERPEVLGAVNHWLIILVTACLLVAVGLSVRPGRISNHVWECFVIGGIKFFATPLIIASVAFGLGYTTYDAGLPFRVAVVMASMPVAFNALIPPVLYDLDEDLANSCWLFTTGALVVVLPVLYFLVG